MIQALVLAVFAQFPINLFDADASDLSLDVLVVRIDVPRDAPCNSHAVFSCDAKYIAGSYIDLNQSAQFYFLVPFAEISHLICVWAIEPDSFNSLTRKLFFGLFWPESENPGPARRSAKGRFDIGKVCNDWRNAGIPD